jgi:hypothetical protein
MDALLQDDAEGVFHHHELMCASRHRARHPKPPNVLGIEFCGRTRQKSKLVENDDTAIITTTSTTKLVRLHHKWLVIYYRPG